MTYTGFILVVVGRDDDRRLRVNSAKCRASSLTRLRRRKLELSYRR